jgi:hypothetical protein
MEVLGESAQIKAFRNYGYGLSDDHRRSGFILLHRLGLLFCSGGGIFVGRHDHVVIRLTIKRGVWAGSLQLSHKTETQRRI